MLSLQDYKYMSLERSYGCVLYEMATLTTLFDDTSSRQIHKKIENFKSENDLVNMKDINGEPLKPIFENVIRRCMNKILMIDYSHDEIQPFYNYLVHLFTLQS